MQTITEWINAILAWFGLAPEEPIATPKENWKWIADQLAINQRVVV